MLLRVKETCVNRIGRSLDTSGPKVENLAKYGSGFGTSEFDFGQAGKNSKRWPNATKIGVFIEKHTYFKNMKLVWKFRDVNPSNALAEVHSRSCFHPMLWKWWIWWKPYLTLVESLENWYGGVL